MEKTSDHILETEQGFATYRYLEPENAVYIIDLYVLPEFRKEGCAAKMADAIVKASKELGFKKLLGSVVPTSKDSTTSLKVLIAYGMKLKSSSENFIVFEKDI